MGLELKKTFKGINLPSAYAKVNHVSIVPSTPAEDGTKLYKVFLQVNTYTDNTCEYDIDQRTYELQGVKEDQFNLADCYVGLKLQEDFAGAKDV